MSLMKKIFRISTLALLLVAGCATAPAPIEPAALPVCYHDALYHFTFFLPASWRGYSVVHQEWAGISYLPEKDADAVTAQGPTIVLRHPQWQASARRQDIPIMIFTRQQWDADKHGKFATGAGGFDEEIGHNSRYVFAVSSRFNAADMAPGSREAGRIVHQNQAVNGLTLYPE
jgi:hypothetical protein